MQNIKDIRKKLIKRFLSLFIVLLLLITAFNNGLVLREYSVSSSKLTGNKSIKIVLISDLHSHIFGENQQDLLSRIKKLKPDLIALTGDIVDDNEPIDGAVLLFQGIKKIAPAYYVTGNHEFNKAKGNEIKALIRKYGVHVLEDNICTVQIKGSKLNICGIDDPNCIRYDSSSYYDSKMEAFKNLPNNSYNILLAHRPEQMNLFKKYNFDLVLSGHAHGGQWRIPFILNGLYVPDEGLFPKYAGGMYSFGSLTNIVSRGLSYNPKMPRIFNPPEIVSIELVPQRK